MKNDVYSDYVGYDDYPNSDASKMSIGALIFAVIFAVIFDVSRSISESVINLFSTNNVR